MKLNHKNLEIIEKWLETNELNFSSETIRNLYHSEIEPLYDIFKSESIKTKNRAYLLQYDFVRRDLLKIAYKKNDYSAKGIKAGFVYAIKNPAWNDYVKIGSAIDVYERLNSYQTSSPLRDYSIIDYYFVEDRLLEERTIHNLIEERNSEWCKISEEQIKELFTLRKQLFIIKPLKSDLIRANLEKFFTLEKSLKIKDNKSAMMDVVRHVKELLCNEEDFVDFINKKLWIFKNKGYNFLEFKHKNLNFESKIEFRNNQKYRISIL